MRPAGPLSVITEVTVALEWARSSGSQSDDARAEVGVAYFGTVASACEAMRTVVSGGALPVLLEFVVKARLAVAAGAGLLGVRDDTAALLVFGGDGVLPLALDELRLIGETCARSGALDVIVPASSAWVASVPAGALRTGSLVLTHREPRSPASGFP